MSMWRRFWCRLGVHGVGVFFPGRTFRQIDGEWYLVCRHCGGGREHVPDVIIESLERNRLAKIEADRARQPAGEGRD